MKRYTHPLAGIQVSFPYENPYPQQRVIMSRLITALKQQKNCLIESPTGTGKSLALLCGALSFIEEQKRLRENMEAKILKTQNLSSPDYFSMKDTPSLNDEPVSAGQENKKLKSVLNIYDDLGRQQERLCAVRIQSNSGKKSPLSAISGSTGEIETKHEEQAVDGELERLPHVPKIFYGTRTHRQVSQVVAEFNRTGYKRMRMTILASRDRMCINKRVVQTVRGQTGGTSVDDECRALMKLARKGQGCILYSKLQKAPCSMYPAMVNQGSGGAWDIEDLKELGQTHTLCPYYWSVQLAKTADITFCPYNYILDPIVRKAMEIDLAGNIVILDEAHNVEDVCRDVMGLELKLSDLQYIENFIEMLMWRNKETYAITQILPSVRSLRYWMAKEGSEVTLTEPRAFNHEKLCDVLEMAQLGPVSWPRTQSIIEKFLSQVADKDDVLVNQELDARCRSVFSAVANTLEHLYKRDMAYTACFRAAISKKIIHDFNNKKSNATPEVLLSIYCLNPAVGFVDIKDKLHSLVVASGTLSPMKSFKCELDMPFPISVSLNHVIAPSQMFARIATRGPNKRELKCDYTNNSLFTLQDDIGQALVRICSKIPNGVLCFFSSYSAMKTMCGRWESTGIWSELEQLKHVFIEGQSSFPEMMQEYFEKSLSSRGALLMAVCRGKVSEGEDFPDNFARAVVVIGLPFPNYKDVTIKDKMAFNDRRQQLGEQVMSGRDWYAAQALRALNQALGRCIRHSADWGAILILESRMSFNPRYKEMLSRWIRDRISNINNFDSLDSCLGEFIQERKTENGMNDKYDSKEPKGRTAREIAKLQGGSGLRSLEVFNQRDPVGSLRSVKTSTKRPHKTFPIFLAPSKKCLPEASSASPRVNPDPPSSLPYSDRDVKAKIASEDASFSNVIENSPVKCSVSASTSTANLSITHSSDSNNPKQLIKPGTSTMHDVIKSKLEDDGDLSDLFSD
ncbi:Fanconi anemia group J protein-like [Tropilaelaps mercedesae]|uniref:DNA 5'-3' helicase n=1 Tax=Tropilaelaps mercedesae TaxID=418985 RepID=A0A1V9XHB9_9ACAR|nr:Fanconi anemia group J protein-like [Tropilaelaps mercedesae]